MVKRRNGREWALQMLCQLDLNPEFQNEIPEEALHAFWKLVKGEESRALEEQEYGIIPLLTSDEKYDIRALPRIRAFAEERIRGVWESVAEIDSTIEPYLENWSFYRLGTVERNAIRLAVWEMLNASDIPHPIIINEAVDITKYYSSTQSSRFVKGVLDRFSKSLLEKQSAPESK